MTRKLLAGAATFSLCLVSATPVRAQEYRFTGFEGPRGANATLNLRIPLGETTRRAPPTLGLTLAYGRPVAGGSMNDRTAVRQLGLVDLRFASGSLRRVDVAGFDLAHFDQDSRLNLHDDSGRNPTLKLILIGLLGVAVGVGAEMLIDDRDEEDAPDDQPTSPGLG